MRAITILGKIIVANCFSTPPSGPAPVAAQAQEPQEPRVPEPLLCAQHPAERGVRNGNHPSGQSRHKQQGGRSLPNWPSRIIAGVPRGWNDYFNRFSTSGQRDSPHQSVRDPELGDGVADVDKAEAPLATRQLPQVPGAKSNVKATRPSSMSSSRSSSSLLNWSVTLTLYK